MGLMGSLIGVLFGGGRNVVKETIEVFRPNEEASQQRDAAREAAALKQFAAEFSISRRGLFDRFVDGLNRLPRPMLAFGTIGLFAAALAEPVWFATRMQGVALIPEPLWWLMGAIVSFYFGARYQMKSQEFQKSLASSLARAQDIEAQLSRLNPAAEPKGVRRLDGKHVDGNAALEEWKQVRDQ